MCSQKELFALFGDIECASGGRTKFNRTALGLPKAHHDDALCVGDVPQTCCIDRTNGYYLSAEAIRHGIRYRSRHKACGIITWNRRAAPKRRFGFQNGDIVRAVIPTGRYQGIHTGRVMTRASGYFSIRTPDSRIVEAKHTFCTKLQPDNGCQYTAQKV